MQETADKETARRAYCAVLVAEGGSGSTVIKPCFNANKTRSAFLLVLNTSLMCCLWNSTVLKVTGRNRVPTRWAVVWGLMRATATPSNLIGGLGGSTYLGVSLIVLTRRSA
jgi:hypothetical protein